MRTTLSGLLKSVTWMMLLCVALPARGAGNHAPAATTATSKAPTAAPTVPPAAAATPAPKKPRKSPRKKPTDGYDKLLPAPPLAP